MIGITHYDMLPVPVQLVQRKRLFEAVVDQLHDLILSGKLKPGDPLPAERELCEMFGVSRTSIRSAIQALEAMGLVQSMNGKATRVKHGTPEELGGIAGVVLFHDLSDANQLYECRRFLETWLVYYATSRLTDQQLDELEELVERRKSEIAAGGLGTDEDFAFHWLIATAAGNEPAARLVYGLLKVVFNPAWTVAEDQSAVVGRHDGILDALRNRDAFAAMREMWYHLTTQTETTSDFPPFPFLASGEFHEASKQSESVSGGDAVSGAIARPNKPRNRRRTSK